MRSAACKIVRIALRDAGKVCPRGRDGSESKCREWNELLRGGRFIKLYKVVKPFRETMFAEGMFVYFITLLAKLTNCLVFLMKLL